MTSSVKVLGLNVSLCLRPAGELKTGVMAWESFPYGKGQSIGSLYTYNKDQNALDIKESGSYFLYVQLSFSCTGKCQSGQFTVTFNNQHKMKEFTCSVSLPEQHKETPQSQTCWRVVTFPESNNRLLAKSEITGQLGDWKLTLNDSGFGMFLVDGLQSVRHTWSQQAWPNWFRGARLSHVTLIYSGLFSVLWWAGLH